MTETRILNSHPFSPRFALVSLLLGLVVLTQAGCGLLIGNIKPVDEKSDEYGVVDLAKENPAVWIRLSSADSGADVKEPEATITEISDIAFQSKKTAAIISLNSSCRPTAETQDKDLRSLTDLLLLGISNASRRVEENLTIQSTPALQTTLQGTLNGSPIALRAVVLRQKTCVYDLLYMAPPTHFKDNESDFSHFVASLRLK